MAKVTVKKNPLFVRIDRILLLFVLLLALGLRLYKIDNPVADWHSWRQADTAAVSRNFVRDGFDLLHPHYDDLGSNQTGHDNPQGLRMVEFPFYNAIVAAAYKTAPLLSLEIYGRLVSAIFSLFTIVVIYYLVLHEESRVAAFFAALTFAIMPFFVYYSRVILPEVTATSLIFLAIFFMYLYSRRKDTRVSTRLCYIISFVLAALALLTKPTTIFYLLPMVYLFYKKWDLDFLKKPQFYLYFVLVALPLIGWRLWIQQFPEGIPASSWLITSVNTYEGQKVIFFRPAFFRWIFYERIAKLILGAYMTTFLIIGIIKKPARSLLLFWIGASTLFYLFTFQGGNVQHDYYQTLILPSIAIFCGLGVSLLLQEKKLFASHLFNIIVVFIVLVSSFLFSFYQVKDLYNTDPDLLRIAQITRDITEPESKLVTDRDGDTTLLYLADRKGYAAVTEDLHGLKNRGMNYFVTLKSEVAIEVRKEFPLIFENEKVFIFKL